MNQMITIEHLGRSITTKYYKHDLSDEECEQIRNEFYLKPDFDLVKNQMNKLYNGGVMLNHIYNYYFFELMCDCRVSHSKWSIAEFMQSNDLIRFAVDKIEKNKGLYQQSRMVNINKFLSLGGKGSVTKLSNFPYRPAIDILEKYNVNDNYYDFSCGWGVRLLASLSKNINYFGTDPNAKLVKELYNLANTYRDVTNTKTLVDIRNLGSEVYIPEWAGKMGMAFSSPPYFDLEIYSTNDQTGQSTENRNYEQWLDEYSKPTIKNIKKYLIDDGYLLYNIKNIKGYDLYDDMKKIIIDEGFELIEEVELKNINRINLQQLNRNNYELVMVFKKKVS